MVTSLWYKVLAYVYVPRYTITYLNMAQHTTRYEMCISCLNTFEPPTVYTRCKLVMPSQLYVGDRIFALQLAPSVNQFMVVFMSSLYM